MSIELFPGLRMMKNFIAVKVFVADRKNLLIVASVQTRRDRLKQIFKATVVQ